MTLKEREEIIKMLEVWTSEYGCNGCPLIDQGCFDCGHIPVEISRNILTLIKELTEEIKDLEEQYDRVYEQVEADIHGNMADGGTSCHWCMDKTKADTVKRMREKLNQRIDGTINVFDFNISECNAIRQALRGVKNDIDQVAKELLEENK